MRQPSDLRDYQQRIITHLYQDNEAICVARMGGGKTAAALTAIQELIRDGVIRHALVIAPKRVACNVWPDELAAWAHTAGLVYSLVTGTPYQRSKRLSTFGVIKIVGIDNVSWLLEQLADYPDDHPIFDLLVIDEISKLRDPTGVRAKLLAKHAKRFKMRWGLSGTLRPNSALDLFMPVRIITDGKLWGRSFYQWRKSRFYQDDFHGYSWKPFKHIEDDINAEIAPLVASLRDDEMPQLPALSVILDHVELPDAAKRQYHDMHRRLVAQVQSGQVMAANAAVATGKMAQLANGFLYDLGDEGDLSDRTTHFVHDEKRVWLEDLVEQVTEPMILVYEFNEDLEMIREVVDSDIPCLGASVGDREARCHIANWNAGRLPFLALHPASGGHGLNLQAGGADMAWIAPTWSPELWEQTIARLHRPGQSRPVMVRVCVARGTVDEMKLDRVHGKMDAQAAFERYLAADVGIT